MTSLSGKEWIFNTVDERTSLSICQKMGVSEIVARILCGRGISLEDVPSFLVPRLKDLLPDPYVCKDMESAVRRVYQAIQNHEKITIYGDYDVDGATSVSLLMLYFSALDIKADYYIPDRLEEGYGVNATAIQHLHDQGTQLVIMVDCGTTSNEQIALGNQLGLDSVVLDHHSTGGQLPAAAAVVNPHRPDQPFLQNLQNLCAAGLVFLFLVGLQRFLTEASFFTIFAKKKPNLFHFCDLVALGTVCDVMPIRGLNRAFVKRGLEQLQLRENVGLRALSDVANLKENLSAYHLGFILGPRINAGGRVGISTLGAQLLTTEDPITATEIAKQLDALNLHRHTLEQQTLEEAILQVENLGLDQRSIILVSAPQWHPGIVGIVASRLTEKYNKPSFVAAIQGDFAKGSGRSVEGIDIGDLLHKSVDSGLLEKGGGHSMAGGFSVFLKKIDDFYNFLCKNADIPMQSYHPKLYVDASIALAGATPELIKELSSLEPFGTGNPAPRWCFHHVTARNIRVVGSNHIQCRLYDETGTNVKAIAFKSAQTPLGEALMQNTSLSVVGTIKKDEWQKGDAAQIIIEDAEITHAI